MATEQRIDSPHLEGEAIRPDVLLRADQLSLSDGWFIPRTLAQADQDLPQINGALSSLRQAINEWAEHGAAPTYAAAVMASRDVINDSLGRVRHRDIARVGYDYYQESVMRSLASTYHIGRNRRFPLPPGLGEVANDVPKTTTRVMAIQEVNKILGTNYPDIESARLGLFLLGAFQISDSGGEVSVNFPLLIDGKSYLWKHSEGLSKAWIFRDWTEDQLFSRPIPRPTLDEIRQSESQDISDLEAQVLRRRLERTIDRQAALERRFDQYLELKASGRLNGNWRGFGEKYRDEIEVYSFRKRSASQYRPQVKMPELIQFPSMFHPPSVQEQDKAFELGKKASRALDKYYQDHLAAQKSSEPEGEESADERLARVRRELADIESRKPKIDPADAIAPILRQLEGKTKTEYLSKRQLGIFRHDDDIARQRLEQFFQGIIIRAIGLRDGLREKIYSNSSYLRQVYSRLDGDLSKADMLLLMRSRMSDTDFYDEEKAAAYRAFSTLVDQLVQVLNVPPQERDRYIRQRRPRFDKKAYHHAPHLKNTPFESVHGRELVLKNYDFVNHATINFTLASDVSEAEQQVITFRFFPRTYARYNNERSEIPQYDDISPDVALQMVQQTQRKTNTYKERVEMVDRAREQAVMASLDIILSKSLIDPESKGKREINLSTLHGEVVEVDEQTERGDSTRADLVFSAEGFSRLKTRMAIGRRKMGKRITVADLRPPLQRYVEDFRGLYI